MAVTEHETFSKAMTVGTEIVLNATDPDTTDGAFELFINLDPMDGGDELELRLYEKPRSADAQQEYALWTFAHDQGNVGFVTPGFLLVHGWKWTAKQTAGTARTFVGSIRKAA